MGTTVYVDKKVMEAVRALVYFRKSRGEKITISDFIGEAIIEKLKKEGVDVE